MAACAATRHLKIQNQPTSVTATAKPKRRKCREIIISSSGAAAATPPPPSPPDSHSEPNFHRGISSNTSQASYQKAEFSPSRPTGHSTPPLPPMEFSYSPSNGALYDVARNFPSGFTKFNSALTAGLLNPMSPPPPISRSSPTLFEMMVNEPDPHSRGTTPPPPQPNPAAIKHHQNAAVSAIRERHIQMQQRIAEMLGNRSPGNMFNDSGSSDIKLTLSDKDGFSVGVSVHRQILVANSGFFAGRLSERWTKQQDGGAPFEVEISDCDDVEVYVETLRLMYCKDLRRMLMKEDVPKVLGILKISAAIGFNAGVFSCLEYLEAAPWAEDEEEKITSLLSELRLEEFGASEVLKRVFSSSTANNDAEEVLKKLLQVVLEGKDEKARREMKGLFLKMLRENTTHNDISKESLYLACEGCLHQLKHHFLQAAAAAAASNLQDVSQIARQADNLHWLLDILIDRQIAEEFVKIWASQTEMSNAHHKVPSVHRFEVSRVTARLFVGIGKGQLLASHDSRFLLLKTWLVPFYDDFGWMKRASNGLDRHVIEDGLSNTILTLPLSWQQEILLAWFDRFLNSGEDCPNIQRGFEVWWRRAFWRRNCEHERSRVRITNGENT